jgi:hypothetical protein
MDTVTYCLETAADVQLPVADATAPLVEAAPQDDVRQAA